MKILIDNGHGENTAGKRSPMWPDGTELREWGFNRDIAKRVFSALQRHGVDVELIVKEDIDVPLSERCNRVNEIAKVEGKNNCLLVSIHANAGGGTGWEAFTSVGETRSDKFATIFYEIAQEMFEGWAIRKDTTDGDPDKESQFYILRKTVCPAILTENFFMDTEKDCKFIMSEIGRRKVADFHVQAILNCIDRA